MIRPRKPRKLGDVQRRVLKLLVEYGWWADYIGAPFYWNGPANTLRVIESLAARGLAHNDTGNPLRYIPTEAGRTLAAEIRYAGL